MAMTAEEQGLKARVMIVAEIDRIRQRSKEQKHEAWLRAEAMARLAHASELIDDATYSMLDDSIAEAVRVTGWPSDAARDQSVLT